MLQCGVHVEQPAGGCRGARGQRERGGRRYSAGDKRRHRGAVPDRRRRRRRRSGCRSNQLAWRETAYASSRRFPQRSAGSRLCCIQHVIAIFSYVLNSRVN